MDVALDERRGDVQAREIDADPRSEGEAGVTQPHVEVIERDAVDDQRGRRHDVRVE